MDNIAKKQHHTRNALIGSVKELKSWGSELAHAAEEWLDCIEDDDELDIEDLVQSPAALCDPDEIETILMEAEETWDEHVAALKMTHEPFAWTKYLALAIQAEALGCQVHPAQAADTTR